MPVTDPKVVLRRALEAIDSLTARLAASEARARAPIAVVGMACRLPGGATTPDAYWKLLREGRSGIREIPGDRWDVEAWYDPDPRAVGKAYTKHGGFLERIDGFDAAFFGIAPREAVTLDPQQRLLLECAWEALEDAAEAPDRLVNSATGVYVGITTSDYARILQRTGEDSDVYSASGTALNAAAGRISFALGLQGPSMAVDTACSSSLTAVHLAVQALRAGECDLALAGGVNVMATPEPFVLFSRWGMISPSGECRTFDASADGFVRGEGCGVLVLKRLDDALSDGNRILAVIRGSAVNQDGPSSGLSVPNGPAQEKVLRRALANAGVDPGAVAFVEAHGTGTILGDPIEVEALGEVYGPGRGRETPLLLGSVKPSIGHLESAAGAAGLLKLVLALRHGEIPPQRNFREPNPRIDWERHPLEVAREVRPWPVLQGRRVGAVSGFGFSGTNVHMVLEAPPEPAPSPAGRAVQLLPLSARTEPALREQARQVAAALAKPGGPAPAEVARTLALGRSALPWRGIVVGSDREALRGRLEQLAAGAEAPGVHASPPPERAQSSVAFLYTGQGSQYPGMGLELREAFPVFRESFDRCAEALRAHGGPDLLAVLRSGSDEVHRTAVTQPALVALEVALTDLLRSWGIVPAALLGHSVGEIAAAAVAGVLSPEEAMGLVAVRGRLMQELPAGGGMLAVAADADTARAATEPFRDRVSLAALNGPADVVLSGALDALEAIAGVLGAAGVETRSLTVSHAFHSPLMDPILEGFRERASAFPSRAPGIPLVSNVTATLDPPSGWDADYWRRHVREAVLYEPSLRLLVERGYRTFLEIGPRPVLTGTARRFLSDAELRWIPTLRGRGHEAEEVLEGLGRLFCAGIRPDWEGVLEGAGRRVALPTYPFHRKRHWVEERREGEGRGPGASAPDDPRDHPLLGRQVQAPIQEALFECVVDLHRRPMLGDHRLAGRVLFPAAAYMEMGAAAARRLVGGGARLEGGWFRAPLILDDDEAPEVRLVATPTGEGTGSFELLSRPPGREGAWTSHAGGRYHRSDEATSNSPAGAPAMDELFRDCTVPVDVASYQARMGEVGLEYGPAFRGLSQAWRGRHPGMREAAGFLRLPPSDGWIERLTVHPGLLDAAFHLIGIALPDDGDHFYLPVGYEAASLDASPGAEARAHVRVQTPDPVSVVADVTVWDTTGTPLVSIRGLRARKVTRRQFLAALGAERTDPLLRVDWVPAPASEMDPEPGSWHVLGGTARDADAVVAALRAAGAGAAKGESVPPREELARLSGIVDLRLLDRPGVAVDTGAPGGPVGADGPELPSRSVGLALEGTVSLLKDIAETASSFGDKIRVVIATRGAHAILPDESTDPSATAAWGLGATAAAEIPHLRLRMLDLADGSEVGAAATSAALRTDGDDRLAARGGDLYVARLVPLYAPAGPAPSPEAGADDGGGSGRLELPEGPYRLTICHRGTLGGLAVESFVPPPPGPGRVEIEVLASGLNFRDVLNLLGMYPGDPGPPGNECCGRVIRVGEGVEGIAPGDLVTCIAEDTFSSQVLADAALTFPVPPELSVAQAAAFPIAQLTAWMALHEVGSVGPGSRVLIHAGAGGVGLAAVHLALAAGAEVVATAGSEAKRRYLLGLGVRAVLDSRRATTAGELREAAGGGLDLVLNSLTGDFIDQGLLALAPGGTFVEIGLREVRTDEEVESLRTDVSYRPLLLGELCRRDPAAVRPMYEAICNLLAAGRIPPPRTRAFPVASAPAAFRHMARARHVGRLAVVHPGPGVPPVRGDGRHLVTGGLGALGLEVAGWLVEQGARHLVLVGRSEPTAEAAARLRQFRDAGATVEVLQADVASPGWADRLAADGGLRIRGVVHAAGIVDDAALPGVDRARMTRALAPKADGLRNLLASLEPGGLDFLILFSSGSALLGSPGQAAYATANAWMDGMAYRLQAEGVPAVSIGWGAWEVGMAGALDERTRREWEGRGIGRLTVPRALALMERAAVAGIPHVAALPVDWSRFLEAIPSDRRPSFLGALGAVSPSGLAAAARGPASPSLREELEALAPRERNGRLTRVLREEIAGVLGLKDADDVDAHAGLMEQGMDSLMTVDLAGRIGRILGVSLPTTFAFEHPTLSALARHLLGQISPDGEDTAGTLGMASPKGPGDVEVQGMTEDELAAELRRELDRGGF